MKNFLSNTSLVKKMAVLYIFFITFPTLLFAIFLYTIQSRQLYEQTLKEHQQICQRLASALNTTLVSAEDLSNSLAYRSSISSLVARADLNEYPIWSRHYSDEIIIDVKYSLKYQNLGLTNATIYTNNPSIPEISNFDRVEKLSPLPFYQDFCSKDKNFDIYYLSPSDAEIYYSSRETEAGTSEGLILFVRKIQPDFPNGYTGLLIFEAKPERIFSPFLFSGDTQNEYSISFENMKTIYTPGDPGEAKKADASDPSLHRKTSTFFSCTLPDYHITVNCKNSLQKTIYTIPALRLSCLLVVMTLFQLLALRLFIKYIFGRINENINEMDQIIADGFSGKIAITSRDEIGLLAQRYNLLLDKIDTLISDIIKKETDSKNAQIKALQYQINPHFIYNTLSIFAGNAQQKRNFELSDAISYFGHLLRYNINNSGLYSTVAQEIGCAESLIKVYSLKYLGKLQLNISVPDELLNLKLIKFLFQPILENSIFHGHSSIDSDMTITLSIFASDDQLNIRITDNGIGIEENNLKQIQKNIIYGTPLAANSKPNSSFIGLHNVYKRIQLVYGSQAGLNIDSIYGQGTTVTLNLPFIQE